MGFCQNCGENLQDSVSFCPKCGSPVGGIVASGGIPYEGRSFAHPMQTRDAQVQLAESVYDYFMQKSDTYEELQRLQRKEANITPPKRWYFMWLALGEGPLVLLSEGKYFLGLLCFVIMIVLFINGHRRFKAKIARCDEEIDATQAQISAICDELADYYRAFPNCPIGPEWTFPERLEALMDYIRSGRADTFKEAMNIMANEHHMRIVEENAEAAAQGANTAAAFSALNFFFK